MKKLAPLPIPRTDVLRVAAQEPPGPIPDPGSVKTTPRSEPSQAEVAEAGSPFRYPFTKSVSIRNDGLGYGEIVRERYACFVGGSFKTAELTRSTRTRTSRTYPNLAGTPRPLSERPAPAGTRKDS